MNIYELSELIFSLKNENKESNRGIIEFYERKLNELKSDINTQISRILNGLDPLPYVQKKNPIDPKIWDEIFNDPIFKELGI